MKRQKGTRLKEPQVVGGEDDPKAAKRRARNSAAAPTKGTATSV